MEKKKHTLLCIDDEPNILNALKRLLRKEDFRLLTGSGFFKTGDRARKDRFGNITITGRIKDIINRGGEKISALEIERRMLAHEDIREAAVIGMPDAVLGERICAYAVSKPGIKLTFEDIIVFLKEEGASVQQLPERIEFIDQMPVTKVGKLDKKALREDINKRMKNV